MEGASLPIVQIDPPLSAERGRLVRRARGLAWLGIGWHVFEATIAIAAGLAASSIALIGFGADSVIESAAGFVVLWLFAAPRAGSAHAERRAQQGIAVSFYVLAAYIAVEAIRALTGQVEPATSWVGIGLAAVTLVTMPPLAWAKEKVANELNSSATAAEGRQNMLCAYLSAALLVGLGANALLGWWWADPATALLIAAVAIREGRDSWRGKSGSCCAPTVQATCCEPSHKAECCGSDSAEGVCGCSAGRAPAYVP